MAKWTGKQRSVLVAHGKVVHPGEESGLSKAEIEHLKQHSNSEFEGHESNVVAVATQQRGRDVAPRGDRGEVLEEQRSGRVTMPAGEAAKTEQK